MLQIQANPSKSQQILTNTSKSKQIPTPPQQAITYLCKFLQILANPSNSSKFHQYSKLQWISVNPSKPSAIPSNTCIFCQILANPISRFYKTSCILLLSFQEFWEILLLSANILNSWERGGRRVHKYLKDDKNSDFILNWDKSQNFVWFWINLGIFRDHFWTMWGSFWDHLGSSFWGHLKQTLDFWAIFQTFWRFAKLFWSHLSPQEGGGRRPTT